MIPVWHPILLLGKIGRSGNLEPVQTRTNTILKISDRFGPVGPRTRRSVVQFSIFLLICLSELLSIGRFPFFQALAKTLKTNTLLEVLIFVEEGSRIEIGVNESMTQSHWSHHLIKRMHKLKLLYSYLANSSSDSCCIVVQLVYLHLVLLTLHQMVQYCLLTDDAVL